MKVLRILAVVVGGLALVAWLAWWWLLGNSPVPEESDYFVDAQLRRASMVAAQLGDRPLRINTQLVGQGAMPRAAIMAGESLFEPHPMVHVAYQIVYPNGEFILVDSVHDAAYHETMTEIAPEGVDTPFFPEGYEAVQKALAQAKFIVATHEHGDHIGGIARYPQPLDLVGRLLMTREQLDNDRWLDDIGFPDELRDALEPLEYRQYFSLGPGVSLIRAPGHTPGNQMVYVELANFKRLLLIGDTAWHMDPIREQRYRPRLVTDFFLGEDRAQTMAQYRRLYEIDRDSPVFVIPSHDLERREELIAQGLLGREFEGL